MPPVKIAIFEDEFILANDLKRQIERFDYEVIAIFRKAEDGLKAFKEARQLQDLPDIVLMDISLAGKMNGMTMVMKVKMVLPVPIENSLFEIPSTYQKVNEEELNRLLMVIQGGDSGY